MASFVHRAIESRDSHSLVRNWGLDRAREGATFQRAPRSQSCLDYQILQEKPVGHDPSFLVHKIPSRPEESYLRVLVAVRSDPE
eukprot:scaffold421350_cov38-Attheya_sp.AAC.2